MVRPSVKRKGLNQVGAARLGQSPLTAWLGCAGTAACEQGTRPLYRAGASLVKLQVRIDQKRQPPTGQLARSKWLQLELSVHLIRVQHKAHPRLEPLE